MTENRKNKIYIHTYIFNIYIYIYTHTRVCVYIGKKGQYKQNKLKVLIKLHIQSTIPLNQFCTQLPGHTCKNNSTTGILKHRVKIYSIFRTKFNLI